jgi:hypothetical protein
MEQHAPLVEHNDGGAVLRLIEVCGAPDDADALLDERVDHPPQLASRDRVDADAWLVEQQQPGRAQHGAGKTQLLLHSAGQRAGEAVGEARQIGEGQHPFESVPTLRTQDAPQVCIKVEVLDHREILVKTKALRHVADRVVDGGRLRHHIEPAHAD